MTTIPGHAHALSVGHADLLSTVKLFAGLDRVARAKLAAQLESMSLAAGDELFRQGEPGDALYIVARGSFGAYLDTPDDPAGRRLSTIVVGDTIGEIALLGDHPRSATVRADTAAEVLRLDRHRFLALARQDSSVALCLAHSLGERLRARDLPPAAAGAPSMPVVPIAPTTAPSATAAPRRRFWPPSRAQVGMLMSAAILVGGWFLTPPPGLSVPGWHALVTLFAIVPMLALDALPEGIMAVLLAGVWVVGGVVRPAVALSGYSTESWVLVVAVLVVGVAIAASGLLYRVALWAVAHSRGGFAGQVSALALAGVVLGPAVPNGTARVTLVAPLLTELVEALGHAPRSRAAAGLAMATLIGFGQMGAVFLTSSTTAVLVYALLPRGGPIEVNWVSWALMAAPTSVLMLIGLLASIFWFHRPQAAADQSASQQRREVVELQRGLLGPPTRNEKISLAVGAAMLLGFATQPLHGIHPTWVAVLALTALGGSRVVTLDTLRNVNWSFALMFGMLASMARVFVETGLDRWIAASVSGPIGQFAGDPLSFVAALSLLCIVVSFVVRWQAAAPLITIAMMPVAAAAGIHPFVVGVVALVASNGFFLPYQSTLYLSMFHGCGGALFSHPQARATAIAYGVFSVLALCASVPAWRAMGLL